MSGVSKLILGRTTTRPDTDTLEFRLQKQWVSLVFVPIKLQERVPILFKTDRVEK